MTRWFGQFVALAGLGVVAAAIAVIPVSPGSANGPTMKYRQVAPMVAGDSVAGPATNPGDSSASDAVTRLTDAGTAQARESAINDIFGTLGIGVYSSNGTQVVGGAEKSAQDFYYYQQETQIMAASFDRGERWSFDDIAAFLNIDGLLADNATVTAAQVRTAVSRAIDAAANNPTAPGSFEPELVRQLGLKHSPPDDLAVASSDTSAMNLDAVQRAVILDDFLITMPRVSEQVAATSNLAAQSRGILRQTSVTAAANCGNFAGPKAVRGLGNFAAGFVEVAGTVIKAITLPLDAFHGAGLAYGVDVEALSDNLKTHYGHEEAGKQLQFQVRVRMLDEVPQKEVDCGWLAGLTFPQQGPIPGVKVEWDTGALESHGSVTCGVACQQTGDDGIATLLFQPKQEKAPYTGPLASEKGRVEATAYYLSSLGNMFGPVSDVVTPKTADILWQVEWHSKGSWVGQIHTQWDVEGRVATGTLNVRFDIALPAPGEGDTHTDVYQMTLGSSDWSQTLDDCEPATRTGTTLLDPGSASLTVTEKDGTMTYEFVSNSFKQDHYTVVCRDGDDNPISVDLFSFPAAFAFPQTADDSPSFQGQPQPIGDTITGSTVLAEDDGSVSWSWTLVKQ